MDSFRNRLEIALNRLNMKPVELAKRLGIQEGTISSYRTGRTEPRDSRCQEIADVLGVDIVWLMGFDVPMIKTDSNVTLDNGSNYVEIPTIGEIAASYNMVANSDVDLEPAHLPVSKLKGHRVDEFISLKVKGDSMFPEYKDGDLVIILSQPKPDYNGQVGAVIHDGEIGTLKKINYDNDIVTLTPINPYYPPIKVTDLDNYHYIGKPYYLERFFDE